MPPLRQPPTMAQMAEQQMVDMVAAAGEGLVETPGDPMHAAVILRLHAAVRTLPEEAAVRLSQAALMAVDKVLVYDELERATSEVVTAISSWRAGLLAPSSDAQPSEILADLAGLAALSSPVDEDVMRALLIVSAACLPEHFSKVDTTELSTPTINAVVSQLPRLPRLESLRLTSSLGCAMAPAATYPLARALHAMPLLSVVSLAQSATDNVLRVLAQACPNTLEELDVSRSWGVTDKGIAALRPCANLRVLKLTRTSATVAGAAGALRDFPSLRTLGHVPDLGRAILAAAREDDDEDDDEWEGCGRRGRRGARGSAAGRRRADRQELQLRAYKSDRPPPLGALAEHCPRLDDVNITLFDGGPYYRIPSLASLTDALPNLNRLNLTCEDMASNDLVGELLDWPEYADECEHSGEWNLSPADLRGTPWAASSDAPRPQPSLPAPVASLTVLKLQGTPLSAWDMWVIGHTMPGLQELGLASAPPSTSPRFRRAPCPDNPLPEGAFRRLRLFYVEDLLPDAELLVLSRAVALEEVGMYHWDPTAKRASLSDEALLAALRNNPLERLRVFSVDMAPYLGVRAVERLLECPQLQTLASVDTWGLGPGQLQALQIDVASRNLDTSIL